LSGLRRCPGLTASNSSFENPYLRWAALVFVLLNVVNTNGEYIVGSLAVQAAKAAAASDLIVKVGAYIGTFYGEYFST
jgi:hypothetical protein